MTVSATARRAGPYSCNGATVSFAFSFKVFADADIRVVKADSDGLETDLTLTTHYSVSRNADQENNPGGTITTVATYATGNTITIVGAVAYTQTADITNAGGFFPEVVENALDRATILVQQLKELFERSITFPASDTTPAGELVTAANRANKWLAFDADGNPEAAVAAPDTAVVSAFMETVLDDTSALAARTTLGVGTGDSPTFAGVTTTGTLTANGNVVLGDNAADTLRMTNDVFQNTGAKNLGFNTAPYGSWYSACYSLEMGGPGYGIYTQSDTTRLMSNVVRESGGYKYARNDYAHLLALESGAFGVSLAGSGTAGNAITFVNALNLTTTALTVASAEGIRVDTSTSSLHSPTAYFRGASTSNFGVYCYAVDENGASAAGNALTVARSSATGRSINAGGTINASGADYAEYERKSRDCGVVAKGQIIGFDADGQVTDKWAKAISFGVKSTNPSLVGGDAWGSEDALGLKIPNKLERPKPVKRADENQQDFEQRLRKHRIDVQADEGDFEIAKGRFESRLEAARQEVDRIAYSGKVPVNVTGAAAGDYIIPVRDGGGIKGAPVAAPTFDQYRIAVGQVRKILPDGRALIAVKVG